MREQDIKRKAFENYFIGAVLSTCALFRGRHKRGTAEEDAQLGRLQPQCRLAAAAVRLASKPWCRLGAAPGARALSARLRVRLVWSAGADGQADNRSRMRIHKALEAQGVDEDTLGVIDVALGRSSLLKPEYMQLLEQTMPPRPIDDFNGIMGLYDSMHPFVKMVFKHYAGTTGSDMDSMTLNQWTLFCEECGVMVSGLPRSALDRIFIRASPDTTRRRPVLPVLSTPRPRRGCCLLWPTTA